MKSREKLYKELRKECKTLTSYEKTRLLVEVDRILTTPHRDHRIEFLYYSVRYIAVNKTIYIYNKIDKDSDIDENEYLTDSETNIEGYIKKIKITTLFNI